MPKAPKLTFDLFPKQRIAFETKANEILYGGAMGGGKSYLLRIVAIVGCLSCPGLQVYLFRRIRPDLIKNHMEGPHGFRALLAPLVSTGFAQIVEDQIRFPALGSKIYLCHCQDDRDRYNYAGTEMHLLLIDELTHFSEVVYRFLRTRVRAPGLNAPAKWQGYFPRILCASNPGNIGHSWVRRTWINFASPLEIAEAPIADGGMLRQFIPARLEDNPAMLVEDPNYEARLEGLGSAEQVRAFRWGDWNVIQGAFFDSWSHKLIIRPFEVPKEWLRLRSYDHGFSKPFSVGWWSVADGSSVTDSAGQTHLFPRGAMIRYREWYGSSDGMENVGLRLNAPEIAAGIRARETVDERIQYSVADPAIFTESGHGSDARAKIGRTIAETFSAHGILFRPADNRRINGWQQMRDRMGRAEDEPMIYCFESCLNSIRTIPTLPHDEARPEDLDTDAEDHAADEWRYACMSRPYVRQIPSKPKPKEITELTLNDVWREHENQSRRDDSWRI